MNPITDFLEKTWMRVTTLVVKRAHEPRNLLSSHHRTHEKHVHTAVGDITHNKRQRRSSGRTMYPPSLLAELPYTVGNTVYVPFNLWIWDGTRQYNICTSTTKAIWDNFYIGMVFYGLP